MTKYNKIKELAKVADLFTDALHRATVAAEIRQQRKVHAFDPELARQSIVARSRLDAALIRLDNAIRDEATARISSEFEKKNP